MGANAAHKAAFWGRPDVMKLLAKSRLDLNARGGYNGYTPLHDAVAQGHVEVVKVLLNAGVRTDIRGHDGKTALDLAKTNSNSEILILLGRCKGDGNGLWSTFKGLDR
jgi:ankyrin repeat protein